ncbi:hypothetical protein Btru_034167, partial [Bulinus truncatus]
MEYQVYLLLSVWMYVLFNHLNACPERCFCSRSHVRCMFISLETVPQNIPVDTTLL